MLNAIDNLNGRSGSSDQPKASDSRNFLQSILGRDFGRGTHPRHPSVPAGVKKGSRVVVTVAKQLTKIDPIAEDGDGIRFGD